MGDRATRLFRVRPDDRSRGEEQLVERPIIIRHGDRDRLARVGDELLQEGPPLEPRCRPRRSRKTCLAPPSPAPTDISEMSHHQGCGRRWSAVRSSRRGGRASRRGPTTARAGHGFLGSKNHTSGAHPPRAATTPARTVVHWSNIARKVPRARALGRSAGPSPGPRPLAAERHPHTHRWTHILGRCASRSSRSDNGRRNAGITGATLVG